MMSLNGSVDQAKDELRGLLSKDEFTKYHQEGSNFLRNMVDKILQWIAKLFPRFSMTKGTENTAYYVVIGILLVLLITVIVWLTKQWIQQKQWKQRIRWSEEDLEKPASFYLEQAKQWGAQEQWRKGVRSAFLSLLIYLNQQQWIRIEKWKTNWEYKEELETNHVEAISMFEDAAQLFERVWYGKEKIESVQFIEYLMLIEKNMAKEETYGSEQ